MSDNPQEIVRQLHLAQTLIREIIAIGGVYKFARKAQKTRGGDIHQKEERQKRRNFLSDKSTTAFEQVYELAQSENVAEQSAARAVMYAILARLATVNEMILTDAGDEEIFSQIQKLKEDNRRFENTAGELEKRLKAKTNTP